jgi:acyl-CoA synthetase (AMP-forming)/AMP-acid ligase II
MLCSNQTMLATVWPELARERPRIVDWLPWSHCFGGSHNFGMIMHNGGSLYVDGGRPVPGLFERTLENLREMRPTIVFSVPRGFALLLEHLNADADFAASFFSGLRIICSGGAALPDPLREALFGFAQRYSEHGVRITSSWGTTECAPFATTSWGEPEPDIDTIGTPAPRSAGMLTVMQTISTASSRQAQMTENVTTLDALADEMQAAAASATAVYTPTKCVGVTPCSSLMFCSSTTQAIGIVGAGRTTQGPRRLPNAPRIRPLRRATTTRPARVWRRRRPWRRSP